MTIQGQSLKSQKEEKRIRMIQAAYELFSEKGVYKTSIDDIAKSAGVAKGTFYLYFADKTEIWEAVVVISATGFSLRQKRNWKGKSA